jgi:8-oxo-dGTP pyrophosphatase MutT (NUDIX family)
MPLRMPDELVARARAQAQGGEWTAPEALPAATIVLLRDGAEGLEVLLMQRPSTMRFAPGMHVFPGGRVDVDSDAGVPVHGSLPGPPWAATDLARALVVAAVRETFEEAGVLLAVDRAGRYPSPDARWAEDRRASEVAAGFPAVIARRRLHLDADLLVPVAHWITPEIESRRFDTRFVAAVLPTGQEVDPHETETDAAHWATPQRALAEHRAGTRPMLPPTVAVLADLAGQRSAPEALAWARARQVRPLMPRPRSVAGEVVWDLVDGYTGEVVSASVQPAASEERGAR